MSDAAVPFPTQSPDGFYWLEDEPEFNPSIHLALEKPSAIHYLSEFGYSEAEISTKATPVATSAPFRVLSSAGAEILLQTAIYTYGSMFKKYRRVA